MPFKVLCYTPIRKFNCRSRTTNLKGHKNCPLTKKGCGLQNRLSLTFDSYIHKFRNYVILHWGEGFVYIHILLLQPLSSAILHSNNGNLILEVKTPTSKASKISPWQKKIPKGEDVACKKDFHCQFIFDEDDEGAFSHEINVKSPIIWYTFIKYCVNFQSDKHSWLKFC